MGDFNTFLPIANGMSRQQFDKDTEVLKNTINEIYLIDILRNLKDHDRVCILFMGLWNIYQNCLYVGS